MDYVSLGLGIVIGGLLAGISVFAFFGRKTTSESEFEIVRLQTQLEEQQKHATEMQERMNETFAKISLETVNQNSKSFLQIAETSFAPLKSEYDKAQKLMHELEAKRVGAYAAACNKKYC